MDGCHCVVYPIAISIGWRVLAGGSVTRVLSRRGLSSVGGRCGLGLAGQAVRVQRLGAGHHTVHGAGRPGRLIGRALRCLHCGVVGCVVFFCVVPRNVWLMCGWMAVGEGRVGWGVYDVFFYILDLCCSNST